MARGFHPACWGSQCLAPGIMVFSQVATEWASKTPRRDTLLSPAEGQPVPSPSPHFVCLSKRPALGPAWGFCVVKAGEEEGTVSSMNLAENKTNTPKQPMMNNK